MAGKCTGGYNVEVINSGDNERFKCMLCLDIIKMATHGCTNHVFCKECIDDYIESSNYSPASQLTNSSTQFLADALIAVGKENFMILLNNTKKIVKKRRFCATFVMSLSKGKTWNAMFQKLVARDKLLANIVLSYSILLIKLYIKLVVAILKFNAYISNFGCTEMIKRNSMDNHNAKNNGNHLQMVTKRFAEENRQIKDDLESANRKLQLVNKDLASEYRALEQEMVSLKSSLYDVNKKLQSLTDYIDCKVMKSIFSTKPFADVLTIDPYNDMLRIGKCYISISELIKCFDSNELTILVKSLISQCHELVKFRDELKKFLSASSMLKITISSGRNFLYVFKTKQDIYFSQSTFSFRKTDTKFNFERSLYCAIHTKLFLLYSPWRIEIAAAQIDVSKPDETFQLSENEFETSSYFFIIENKSV